MSGHNIANVEVDFYNVAFCDIFLKHIHLLCTFIDLCVPFKNVLLLKKGFLSSRWSLVKSQFSQAYSPMSVPPPKRGKFIFDHTELFVYKFYINIKEIFFGIRQQ